MKQLVFPIFLSLITTSFSYSQDWSLSGNLLSGTATAPTQYFGSNSLHDLVFKTNTSFERLRIASSNGFVGINSGGTAPARQLHVQTSQTNGGLRITQTGVSGGFCALELFHSGNGGKNYAIVSTSNANLSEGPGCFGIYDYSSSKYRMFITSNGLVGIGESFSSTGATAPATLLHVKGDLTLGENSATPRKWRFITQNWMNYGQLFIQPDDATGNTDPTKALSIDPRSEFTTWTFGNQFGNIRSTLGKATGMPGNGVMYFSFNAIFNNSSLAWDRNGSANGNGGAVMWSDASGKLFFSTMKSTGTSAGATSATALKDDKAMEIKTNATSGIPQVLIGRDDIGSLNVHKDSYSLAVDGKLIAKEIFVTITDWPDYVFEDGYKLRTIDELNSYIRLNKHLPNVSSSKEMEENGIDAGQTYKMLMEKVEELTLYIIDLNKKIEILESKK